MVLTGGIGEIENASSQENISSQHVGDFLTVAIAIFPLADLIISPIQLVSMGTIIIIICILASMISLKNKILHFSSLTVFMLYVMTITIVNIACDNLYGLNGIVTVIQRLLRFTLITGSIAVFDLYKIVNSELLFKTIRIVSITTAIITITQFILKNIGIQIPNILSIFSTSELYSANSLTYLSLNFRPSGLFFEPAHMSQYCLPYIIWQLFDKRYTLGRLRNVIITLLGILASGSAMGICLSTAFLLLYIFVNMKKNVLFILPLAVVIILVIVFLRSEYGMNVIYKRLFTDAIDVGGNAIEGRIGRGYDFFFTKGWIERCIGSGYGNVPLIYLNGLEYILNTVGIVGLIWFLFSMINIKNSSSLEKMFFIIYILFLSVAQVFTPASMAYYSSLIYCSKV